MSIYRNGLRLKTARFHFFYTEPYPQDRVTQQKNNRILLWGYAAHVDLQYFGFSYSHSRSFRIDKYIRLQKKKKRLVTTPKGDACAPLQLVTFYFNAPV